MSVVFPADDNVCNLNFYHVTVYLQCIGNRSYDCISFSKYNNNTFLFIYSNTVVFSSICQFALFFKLRFQKNTIRNLKFHIGGLEEEKKLRELSNNE